MVDELRPPGADDRSTLAAGEAVGRYRVLAHVGGGAMGIVYAAHDPQLDRKVALKLVRAGPDAGSLGRSRLQREALALARLSHPNVVAIHDVGLRGDEVWLAMEYVEGRTVTRWLAEAPRGWSEVLEVMIRVGRGLEAAHAGGIVHRDVKPDNVLIGDPPPGRAGIGRIVVGDFGLARASGDSLDLLQATSEPSLLGSDVTHAGALLGTPAYMSPEQLTGRTADAKSDQFGFAVMMWEAFHGRRPFAGDTAYELAAAILAGEIEAPRRRVPAGLRRVVERGLARDPARRHASVGAMVDALEREAARLRRRPRMIATVAAAITVVAVLGLRQFDMHRNGSCASRAAEIDAVWNDEVAARIRSAMTEVDPSGVALSSATPWIDGWTAQWKQARLGACDAASAYASERVASPVRVRECFDARKDELASLLELWSVPDAAMVPHLVSGAAALGSVQTCTEPARLAAPIDPAVLGVDPEIRDRLRHDLQHARAQMLVGRPDTAADEAAVVAASASARGLDELAAEAHAHAGVALERASRWVEAEAHLHRATVDATALGLDDVAADSASALALVVGARLGRGDEGLMWAEVAEMLLRRHDAADGLGGATLHLRIAAIEARRGEIDEAERHGREALRIREALLGPEHPDVATVLDDLALVHETKGAFEVATELRVRALAIRTAAFGTDHPLVASSRRDLVWRLGPAARTW